MYVGEKKSSGLCGIAAGPQSAPASPVPRSGAPDPAQGPWGGGTVGSPVQAQRAAPASPSKASFSSSLPWVKPLLLNGQIQA